MRSIRVFLWDKSPVFLKAAANYLTTWPGIEVVGQAHAGADALSELGRLQPDLVFIEPFVYTDGLSLVERLRELVPSTRIVILSDHDEQPYRDLAAAAAVDGYVVKSEFCGRLPGVLDRFFAEEASQKIGAGNQTS